MPLHLKPFPKTPAPCSLPSRAPVPAQEDGASAAEADAFLGEDIEQILAKRTSKRTIGGKAGNMFSSISFDANKSTVRGRRGLVRALAWFDHVLWGVSWWGGELVGKETCAWAADGGVQLSCLDGHECMHWFWTILMPTCNRPLHARRARDF